MKKLEELFYKTDDPNNQTAFEADDNKISDAFFYTWMTFLACSKLMNKPTSFLKKSIEEEDRGVLADQLSDLKGDLSYITKLAYDKSFITAPAAKFLLLSSRAVRLGQHDSVDEAELRTYFSNVAYVKRPHNARLKEIYENFGNGATLVECLMPLWTYFKINKTEVEETLAFSLLKYFIYHPPKGSYLEKMKETHGALTKKGSVPLAGVRVKGTRMRKDGTKGSTIVATPLSPATASSPTPTPTPPTPPPTGDIIVDGVNYTEVAKIYLDVDSEYKGKLARYLSSGIFGNTPGLGVDLSLTLAHLVYFVVSINKQSYSHKELKSITPSLDFNSFTDELEVMMYKFKPNLFKAEIVKLNSQTSDKAFTLTDEAFNKRIAILFLYVYTERHSMTIEKDCLSFFEKHVSFFKEFMYDIELKDGCPFTYEYLLEPLYINSDKTRKEYATVVAKKFGIHGLLYLTDYAFEGKDKEDITTTIDDFSFELLSKEFSKKELENFVVELVSRGGPLITDYANDNKDKDFFFSRTIRYDYNLIKATYLFIFILKTLYGDEWAKNGIELIKNIKSTSAENSIKYLRKIRLEQLKNSVSTRDEMKDYALMEFEAHPTNNEKITKFHKLLMDFPETENDPRVQGFAEEMVAINYLDPFNPSNFGTNDPDEMKIMLNNTLFYISLLRRFLLVRGDTSLQNKLVMLLAGDPMIVAPIILLEFSNPPQEASFPEMAILLKKMCNFTRKDLVDFIGTFKSSLDFSPVVSGLLMYKDELPTIFGAIFDVCISKINDVDDSLNLASFLYYLDEEKNYNFIIDEIQEYINAHKTEIIRDLSQGLYNMPQIKYRLYMSFAKIIGVNVEFYLQDVIDDIVREGKATPEHFRTISVLSRYVTSKIDAFSALEEMVMRVYSVRKQAAFMLFELMAENNYSSLREIPSIIRFYQGMIDATILDKDEFLYILGRVTGTNITAAAMGKAKDHIYTELESKVAINPRPYLGLLKFISGLPSYRSEVKAAKRMYKFTTFILNMVLDSTELQDVPELVEFVDWFESNCKGKFAKIMEGILKTVAESSKVSVFLHSKINILPISNVVATNFDDIKKYLAVNDSSAIDDSAAPTLPAKKRGEGIIPYVKRLEDEVAAGATGPAAKIPKPFVNLASASEADLWEESLLLNYKYNSQEHTGHYGHLMGFKIIKKYESSLHNQQQYDAYFDKLQSLGANPIKVAPQWHGTGTIPANMILRYGFKILDEARVGSGQGRGIYCAPYIDKSCSYVGDYQPGTTTLTRDGYIFELEVIVGKHLTDGYNYTPATELENYREAKFNRTTEYCVYTRPPMDAFLIKKVYYVEIIDLNIMKTEWASRGWDLSKIGSEAVFIDKASRM